MQRILLLIFVLNSGLLAEAQRNLSVLDSLCGAVLRPIRGDARETALLSTDKRFYQSDEYIWYRVFLVNAASGRISTKSKILYVDLVNRDDKPIVHAMLNAGRQQTSGDFRIPDNIPTGDYWLRAYTRQMISDDSLDCAVSSIYIYNPRVPAVENATVEATTPTVPAIDVFPEGGSLITATQNLVGIYAHDQNENPLQLRIYLIDNLSRDTLALGTDGYGLGSFTFVPNRFKKYSLITTYNGSLYRFALPPYDFWGGRLSVRQGPDRTLVVRTVLEDSLAKAGSTTYLMAIQGDSLCYAAVGSGSFETTVSETSLPDGIVTFLLYNYQLKLISERRVYVGNHALKVSIASDKASYKPREKALLTTTIQDWRGNGVPSSVCIKVLDSATEQLSEKVGKGELIRQLRSRELDQWTLLHLTDLTDRQLDQMLLRRSALKARSQERQKLSAVSWKDSIFTLQGQIINAKGAPMADQPITLISETAKSAFLLDSTDKNGRFSVSLPELTDSTPFYLQVGNVNNLRKDAVVKINNDSFPVFSTPEQMKYFIPLQPKQAMKHVLAYDDRLPALGMNVLKPVVVATSLPKQLDYNAEARISKSSTVVTPAMIHRAGSNFMENAIRMIPGLQILGGYVILGGLNDFNGPNAKAEPLVLMDGVEVPLPTPSPPNVSPVLEFFNELNANEVDFMEVFKGGEGSIFGIRGGNGVIYIHSARKVYTGNLPVTKDGLFKFYAKGFSKEDDFRQPDYTLNEFNDSKADLRSTLFWGGNLLTDFNGKVLTAMFMNDRPGTYIATITGITVHGQLIYQIAPLHSHRTDQ